MNNTHQQHDENNHFCNLMATILTLARYYYHYFEGGGGGSCVGELNALAAKLPAPNNPAILTAPPLIAPALEPMARPPAKHALAIVPKLKPAICVGTRWRWVDGGKMIRFMV
jgi:hypothetical protein